MPGWSVMMSPRAWRCDRPARDVVGTPQHLHGTDASVGEPWRLCRGRRAALRLLPVPDRARPSGTRRGDRGGGDGLARCGGCTDGAVARQPGRALPETHDTPLDRPAATRLDSLIAQRVAHP